MTADICCTPSPEPFEARLHEDRHLAALCTALAHPLRVHSFRFLRAPQAGFAGEIADPLPVAAATVRQLRAAGLFQGEVDGPRRYDGVHSEGRATLPARLGGL